MNFIVHLVTHFYFAHKAIIIIIAMGLLAGLLAQMIMPGRGFGLIATVVLGIAGAWLGNKYIKSHITFMTPGIMKDIVSETAGAILLSFVVNLFRRGKDRDKTAWRHN